MARPGSAGPGVVHVPSKQRQKYTSNPQAQGSQARHIKAPQQGWRQVGKRCWPKGCSHYASWWKRRVAMKSSDVPNCHPQAQHHLNSSLLLPCPQQSLPATRWTNVACPLHLSSRYPGVSAQHRSTQGLTPTAVVCRHRPVAARQQQPQRPLVRLGMQTQCLRPRCPRSYAPARPAQQTAQTEQLDTHASHSASQRTHHTLSCQCLGCC